jgi:Phosphatidylserine/phosphatidylglycerophosphate/cardiolipin synthases and related enzymes
MVKLLNTNHCSSELYDLVKNAQDEIILVSPYLQISPILFNSLKDASSRKVPITLIYRDETPTKRESTKSNEQKEKLRSLNIKMSICENLHAKCYLNESTAIITSMNLYQHSQQNNTELGVRIQKEEDAELYDEIYKEVQSICRISMPSPHSAKSSSLLEPKPVLPNLKPSNNSKLDSVKPVQKPLSEKVSKSSTNNSFLDLISDLIFGKNFYCIRCGTIIEGNSDKPLCTKCYPSWARYKNENYAEKYCFLCGEEKKTTYAKPICQKCYTQKVKK